MSAVVKELKIGDKAPAFSLLSDEGKKVSSKDLKGQAFVIYFYPKDATPGCTQEACDFRDEFAAFRKLKIQVYGVSKDSVESHVKFRAKQKLPFALLSDPDGEACKAFGVWQEKSLYGRKFMGIVRTTFVVGKAGKIAQVFHKVRVKEHVSTVLEAVTE